MCICIHMCQIHIKISLCVQNLEKIPQKLDNVKISHFTVYRLTVVQNVSLFGLPRFSSTLIMKRTEKNHVSKNSKYCVISINSFCVFPVAETWCHCRWHFLFEILETDLVKKAFRKSRTKSTIQIEHSHCVWNVCHVNICQDYRCSMLMGKGLAIIL